MLLALMQPEARVSVQEPLEDQHAANGQTVSGEQEVPVDVKELGLAQPLASVWVQVPFTWQQAPRNWLQ